GLSQHQDALGSYQQAIEAYDEALARAPDYINALNNKGLALQSLGDLQRGLSQHQDALASWQAALTEFEHSLELAPGDEYIRRRRDQLQESLDGLEYDSESSP
ncbi:MAG: tetratricopeptide repeat protein, partial [Leptolyngbyaceae cyanobacterium MO_188.B28]|nr:tetratricopeptide repeat protein [Leptolyngbyaceae cyanobacterium MO_188.B28]